MQRSIYLPLYGTIEHGPGEDLAWDLYQTAELARLRDISLSSLPSRFMPYGDAVSRFQHAVGVAELVRTLCAHNPDFLPWRASLIAAALCHDCGSPPFSHLAETFFFDLTGQTHEQAVAEALREGSGLAEVLERYELDPHEVADIVTGRHRPLGPLMAGSLDLDNVDNSLTLLAALGGGEPDGLPYHPRALTRIFLLREGEVCLDAAQGSLLESWNEARAKLYRILFSEPNLSAARMLYRAMELAYADGRLDADFFTWGEGEAFVHLARHCGPEVGALIADVDRWRHYPRIWRAQFGEDHDPRVLYLSGNWQANRRFADELAQSLRLPAHELVTYAGIGRGKKPIALPFVGPGASHMRERFSLGYADQQLSIFTHRRHQLDPARVEAAAMELLRSVPEGEAPAHTFA